MSKIQSEAAGKTAGVLALSFLLPALTLLAAFAAMGMAPFGERSTLIMDQSGQYVEFLCGLKSGDVFFRGPNPWGQTTSACSPIMCPARFQR